MPYTKEQSDDFMERSKAFAKAVDALYKKHQCEFVPVPKYERGPQGMWITTTDIHIGDLKYKSVESPIAQLMAEGL